MEMPIRFPSITVIDRSKTLIQQRCIQCEQHFQKARVEIQFFTICWTFL